MTTTFDRIVITGAGGRLGTALVGEIESRGGAVSIPWRRPEYDLDTTDPSSMLDRDRPSLVFHTAAWTDVDGCARDPELAIRRNGIALERLAAGCFSRGVPLVAISTNEVFDGKRTDGLGYVETDTPHPANPYGASKLLGEEAASRVFGSRHGLWIVRTGWLYGPPGNDFPAKIVAASDRRSEDDPLPVVADETGSPTYTRDLARALLELVRRDRGGTYHLVSRGAASRYEWASAVLASCRPGRQLRPISQAEFDRPSMPPPWGVLDCSRASSIGISISDWRSGLARYLSTVCSDSNGP